MGILEGVLTWLRLGHTQGSEGCIRDSPLRFAEIKSFQIFFRRPASRWIAIRKKSDGLSIFKLEKQKVLPPDERNPDLGYVKPWLPSLSGLLLISFINNQQSLGLNIWFPLMRNCTFQTPKNCLNFTWQFQLHQIPSPGFTWQVLIVVPKLWRHARFEIPALLETPNSVAPKLVVLIGFLCNDQSKRVI